ncbi:MAG TPA: hypothetical protein VKR53_06750 [Puia sp.]|nr:hypothetical protein [Puia sp.]
MYKYIFFFVYNKKLKSDGPGVARYSASLIAAIALSFHLLLLYAAARFALCYFYGISIARQSAVATRRDSLNYLGFGVLVITLTALYFNKRRAEDVVRVFKDRDDIYSPWGILKFASIFIIPLLISFFLVNKSVYYCAQWCSCQKDNAAATLIADPFASRGILQSGAYGILITL